MNIKSEINKEFYSPFYLFLVAMLLIKLPPLYIFPQIPSKLLTTHSFAKILLSVILFYVFLIKINKHYLFNRALILFTFFLVSISPSIIKAKNLFLFLKDYQNLIFSFIIFTLSYYFATNQKNFHTIFRFIIKLSSAIILLDLTYFFFTEQFISTFKNIIQNEVTNNYLINITKHRYNLYLNTELFLPFLLSYLLTSKQSSHKVKTLFLMEALVFSTFVSGFRHRILFLSFALISYFPILLKSLNRKSKYLLLFITIFPILVSTNLMHMYKLTKITTIDRLLLKNKNSIETIYSRINNFKKSLDLFIYSPIVGVGLGNFQMYQNNNITFSLIDEQKKTYLIQSMSDPHSIISKILGETGILGFLFWAIMHLYFLIQDIRFLKNKNIFNLELYSYIISFWGFFLLSLVTPSITIFRSGWMWFFRGVIEAKYQKTLSKELII